MKSKNTKSKAPAPGHDSTGTIKPTLIAFLLDRSGSMASGREETISGFNAYMQTMKDKDDGSMRFTLTQFDSISTEVLYNAAPLREVSKLIFVPRGNTPLWDAMGETMRETLKQAGDAFKVLFVVLTDGQENASSKFTGDAVKALIKEMETQQHWTFAYIGVGLQGFAQTQAMAAGTQCASNVLHSTHETMGTAYRSFASGSAAYAMNANTAKCVVTNFWDGMKSTEDEDEPPKKKK